MFIILLTVLKAVLEKQKHRTASSLHQRQILLPHTLLYNIKMEHMIGGQCVRFKSYKICSHTIAVAEYNEELHNFVQYFKKSSKNRISDLIDETCHQILVKKRPKVYIFTRQCMS